MLFQINIYIYLATQQVLYKFAPESHSVIRLTKVTEDIMQVFRFQINRRHRTNGRCRSTQRYPDRQQLAPLRPC